MSAPSQTGPQLRLARAAEHLADLKAEIDAFLETKPYLIEREDDPENPDRELFRVRAITTPPARIATLAGDCIHGLRSSLDHLAWQLALLGTDTPNERTEFPICTTREAWLRNCWKIADAPRRARLEVQRVQPYRSPDIPTHELLWILHRLWNVDKHRHLHVLGYATESSIFNLTGESSKSGVNHGPMRDGMVVGWRTGIPPHERPKLAAYFDFAVTFGDPAESFGTLPVYATLNATNNYLRWEVFPRFRACLP